MLVFGLALLGVGFVAGRFIERIGSGYHYEVRETKVYDSSLGEVRWSYVSESVGMLLIDTGTTIIEFDGRTIYKARRAWQESAPYARNIATTQGHISWEDGDYRYDLAVQKITPDQDSGSAGDTPSN